MAQTKAKAKPKKRPASSKRAKTTSKSSKPKTTKAKAKAKAKPKAPAGKAGSSSNGASNGKTHSKVPLVAGGVALAGAAGGMALAAAKKGRKSGIAKAMSRRPKVKIKVDSKDLAKAAKGIGDFSAQVSEIAGGVETAAEGRNGRHRSPVEVVLRGLTARR